MGVEKAPSPYPPRLFCSLFPLPLDDGDAERAANNRSINPEASALRERLALKPLAGLYLFSGLRLSTRPSFAFVLTLAHRGGLVGL